MDSFVNWLYISLAILIAVYLAVYIVHTRISSRLPFGKSNDERVGDFRQ